MIDDRTARLNLPLPNVGNLMKSQDVPRIIAAFQAIDAAIFAKATPADITAAIAAAKVVTNTAISSAIAGLVNAAPGALDTLQELATALGNDANFATTLTSSLALKANTSALAAVALSGSYNDIVGKPATFTPPVATPSILGGVKPGAGLTVDASGILVVISQPPGMISPFAGSVEPSGWLFCYGQAVSRTTYASLFAVLSTVYGVGDSSTTFNLPDMRGRVPAGKDNLGGTAAGRLVGTPGSTIGGALGSQTHALTAAEMASHSHAVTDAGHSHVVYDPSHSHNVASQSGTPGATINPDFYGAGLNENVYGPKDTKGALTGISIYSGVTGISIQSTGSGTAHDITQPTLVLNYIIKT